MDPEGPAAPTLGFGSGGANLSAPGRSNAQPPLLDCCCWGIVHGGAATLLLEAGSTWAFVCWVWLLDPPLELPLEPPPEPLLDPLLDPPLDAAMVHGGTTSVVMLLFSGTTSWFC